MSDFEGDQLKDEELALEDARDFYKRLAAVEQRWREVGDANGWPNTLKVELERLVKDTIVLSIEDYNRAMMRMLNGDADLDGMARDAVASYEDGGER